MALASQTSGETGGGGMGHVPGVFLTFPRGIAQLSTRWPFSGPGSNFCLGITSADRGSEWGGGYCHKSLLTWGALLADSCSHGIYAAELGFLFVSYGFPVSNAAPRLFLFSPWAVKKPGRGMPSCRLTWGSTRGSRKHVFQDESGPVFPVEQLG